MSVLRPALVLAACAAVAASGVASAAPKPVCNLVTDAKGDTFAARYQDTIHELGGPGLYGPAEPALDILSVDVASNGKTITAVVRVDKLAKNASSAPGGLAFRVQFASEAEDDENMYLNAATDGTKDTFTAGTRAITANLSTKLADVKGVFDLAKNEIRISAPVSVFAAQGVKSGAVLNLDFDQTASRQLAEGRAAFADVATGGSTYKVGTPSCVKVGK
jgi:hypothetical protein